MHFETRAIHEGQEPDPATGAITTPIYQTSTYVQEAVGVHKGYDYARVGNPTRTALQECLASLEGAAHGRAFSSGLGAATTLMHLLSPGDHVVAVNDVYGGIYRMFTQVYEPEGLPLHVPHAGGDLDRARRASRRAHEVRLARDADEPGAEHRRHRSRLRRRRTRPARSSSSTTPSRRRTSSSRSRSAPTSSLHSTTKYLGGHSDVIGGFVATNDDGIAEQLAFLQKSLGAVPGPFDAWLVLRGVKTLAVRMDRHCANAIAVASFLERHPRVERVLYPGLPSHPGPRDRRAPDAELRRHGVVPRRGRAGSRRRSSRRTKIWKLAESLGGVESLIEHPAADDACVDGRRAVRRSADADPAVRRHRVGRGPRRRPRRGALLALST